jgi:methylmalonyl-CoA mutase
MWGGSYYVERLTHDLAARAMEHITEIEKIGGMAKAIEKASRNAHRGSRGETQARIDSGRRSIIGVNKFLQAGREQPWIC